MHCTENVGTVFGTVVPLHVPCQSFYPCCPVPILILVFLPSHCPYQNSRTIAPFQLPIQNDSPLTVTLPNFRPFSPPCNYPANITTGSLPIPLTNFLPHQIPHPVFSCLPSTSPAKYPILFLLRHAPVQSPIQSSATYPSNFPSSHSLFLFQNNPNLLIILRCNTLFLV